MVNPPGSGFTQDAGMQGAPPQGNGMAVAGLVLGLIGLVFCWVAIIGWLIGLLGIIFGAVGISKANRIGGKGKGMAIAGLATGLAGIIIGILLYVVIFAAAKHEFERNIEHERELERSMHEHEHSSVQVVHPYSFA
jgi:hypothetical protein